MTPGELPETDICRQLRDWWAFHRASAEFWAKVDEAPEGFWRRVWWLLKNAFTPGGSHMRGWHEGVAFANGQAADWIEQMLAAAGRGELTAHVTQVPAAPEQRVLH